MENYIDIKLGELNKAIPTDNEAAEGSEFTFNIEGDELVIKAVIKYKLPASQIVVNNTDKDLPDQLGLARFVTGKNLMLDSTVPDFEVYVEKGVLNVWLSTGVKGKKEKAHKLIKEPLGRLTPI